jgi:tripartite-type tricarboxylate transporter receptor subunit TctC
MSQANENGLTFRYASQDRSRHPTSLTIRLGRTNNSGAVDRNAAGGSNVLKPAVRFIAALALTMVTIAAGHAQSSFPDKPVKIVVGFPPGGGLDVLIRGVAQELSNRWGKPVVVDNRPGASSIIAAEAVAKSAPDGYTLLAVTDQIYLANRFAFKSLPYDPDKSFASVIQLARTGQFMIAHPSLAAMNLKELITLEKAKPGTINYGHWGDGAPPQLLYETMNKKYGTSFVGVPYKGVAPVLQSLVSNEIQLSIGSSGVAGQLLKTGKVKALAFASTPRHAEFADVPTTTEQGMPDLQAFIWFGIAAPAGTPADIVAKLNADMRDAVRTPAVSERFVISVGWTLVAGTPAEMDATIKSELPLIRDMIANAGVTPQ